MRARFNPVRMLAGWPAALLSAASGPALAAPDAAADPALPLAQAALAACQARHFAVVVIVADAGGVPRVQLADPAAAALDVEAARRKALTAALVRRATATLAEIAAKAPSYAETLRAIDPRVLLGAVRAGRGLCRRDRGGRRAGWGARCRLRR